MEPLKFLIVETNTKKNERICDAMSKNSAQLPVNTLPVYGFDEIEELTRRVEPDLVILGSMSPTSEAESYNRIGPMIGNTPLIVISDNHFAVWPEGLQVMETENNLDVIGALRIAMDHRIKRWAKYNGR